MKTRKQQIIDANFQPQYMLFLFECENEPLPRTEGWKNNIQYMGWTRELFRKLKEIHGFKPSDDNVNVYKHRDQYVKDELNKYIN